MSLPIDLAGRAVIVAGAGGGGIGTAVSGLLAKAGADVIGFDNRAEAFGVWDEALRGTPGQHRQLVVDVRREHEVRAAVAEVAGGGALHGLVHVAGGLGYDQWAPLLDVDLEVVDAVFELNFRAALITMRETARHLARTGGGSIVAIASVVGQSAMPYGASYAAAKAAMASVARTAALEWGSAGIRVNTVAAGTVATAKNAADRAGGLPPVLEAERTALPLGHRGVPDDIAATVLFLMSELASWVTGQTFIVDGGSSTRPSFLDADNLPVFVQNQALRARVLGTGG